ncbi:hypothetical protein [Pantoea agglomerans]|uniref:hypothetical protein n=1 Tax=Enterobacter agglomerans TaxID=549 RepID=UPI003207D036
MPAIPINWNLYSYNQFVINEINDALIWFSIECSTSTSIKDPDNLRINLISEIGKIKNDFPKPELKYALYKLYLDGFIPNPLRLTSQDIDNAIWATNNHKYGIVSSPSIPRLINIPFSNFEL